MLGQSLQFLIRTLLVGFVCSFSTVCFALSPDRDLSELTFAPLKIAGAVPTGAVRAIVQDLDGFIWFGTREGAHRFDGYEVRTFSHERGNAESLIDSAVRSFHVDNTGRLWIGTTDGVSFFLPDTETFRNYRLNPSSEKSDRADRVNSIVRDSQNRIYASTQSGYIYVYDAAADRFSAVNETALLRIKSMAIDERDRIWVGSNGRIDLFDPATKELTTFEEPFRSEDPTIPNFITDICYLDDENIWVGTALNGAVLFNSVTGQADSAPRELQGESSVNLIEIDGKGNVWIGHQSGLTIHEKESGAVYRYHPDLSIGPLPRSSIQSLFKDAQGNIWVGSSFHEIFVSSNNKNFRSIAQYAGRRSNERVVVSSLLEDRSGNLWVGHEASGIDILRSDGSPIVRLRNEVEDSASLPTGAVYAIFEDSGGDVWVGTYRGGLNRYVPDMNGFQQYRHVVGDDSSLGGNDVRDVQEDEFGNLWLLTYGRGLSYFDRKLDRFVNYRSDSKAPDFRLINDWARDIHYATDSKLYIGSNFGLSVLDTKTNTFQHFEADVDDPRSLSSSVVYTIFEDSKRRIWVGTADGVNLLEEGGSGFRSWSTEAGLVNGMVASIVEDQNGHLWLGTDGGLSRFDPDSARFLSYDAGDGITDDSFIARAVVRGSEGELLFGTRNGITFFDPNEIEENDFPPSVWINDFRVFNRSLDVVPSSESVGVLNQSILLTDRVVLGYGQKVISLGFVALNYIQSSKNEYAYRLHGFDRDWNYVGTRREAVYTNLNPGRYTFEVIASNNDGYWSEDARTLEIVVEPPYWKTLWFRGVLLLLLMAGPAFLLRLYLVRDRRKKAELESTVSERTADLRYAHRELGEAYTQLAATQAQIEGQNRELIKHRENLEGMVSLRTTELEKAKAKAERSDRLKSAFLANMSHEIRTPMNAIIGLLDVLQIDSLTEEEREQYTDVIKSSSQTLMTLIDDILDLSRIESGEANIELQSCNCDELVEELYALFRHIAKSESEGAIQVELRRNGVVGVGGSRDDDLVLPAFDPIRLKQVLTNLLSNAIKFTDRGTILFGYDTQVVGGIVRIRYFVTDPGIGIASDQVARVFDRFHKVDSRSGRVYRGTGLGLTISKRLTEMMDGRISVTSEEGCGTQFYVEFERESPLGLAQLSDPRDKVKAGLGKSVEGTNFEGRLEGKRVLVVEDDEINFMVLKKHFDLSGAEIVWSRDGMDAISRFDSELFDLVLLDVKVPIKDGFQVLSYIRSVNTDILVVMQTAHAMDEDHQRALVMGASGFLAKPFTKGVFVRTILDLID